jgi:hypothetical protein
MGFPLAFVALEAISIPDPHDVVQDRIIVRELRHELLNSEWFQWFVAHALIYSISFYMFQRDIAGINLWKCSLYARVARGALVVNALV